MEKLNFFGIGPKMGRIILPWLAITIALSILFPVLFSICSSLRQGLMVTGSLILLTGLVSYFATLRLMLPGIRENRLITGGMYRYCRNPLYSSILLFIIPGLALVMNSWIILTVTPVGYLIMRRFIREEEEMLERIFGEEFRKYRDATPLFVPNPFVRK
ncbi:MAG TPA: isoprenylcysteine carboxylmethyltransferase family protein [Bacteroidales bacterium]|nr:isoprenylcysteine carboxylmethyltransferase family protein [Bacteroidales bacterium]